MSEGQVTHSLSQKISQPLLSRYKSVTRPHEPSHSPGRVTFVDLRICQSVIHLKLINYWSQARMLIWPMDSWANHYAFNGQKDLANISRICFLISQTYLLHTTTQPAFLSKLSADKHNRVCTGFIDTVSGLQHLMPFCYVWILAVESRYPQVLIQYIIGKKEGDKDKAEQR